MEEQEEQRRCRACSRTFDVSNFYESKRHLSGLDNRCIDCRLKKNRENYKKLKIKIRSDKYKSNHEHVGLNGDDEIFL